MAPESIIQNTFTYTYDRFLNARRCYGPSFSPDGTRIAFISDIGGVPQAWTIPARGGWPEQFTFTDDRVGFVCYSPRSDQMVVGTDVGGDENVQLWLLQSNGAVMRPLTTNLAAMHPFGDWSPDARLITYTSNERDRACLDVILQDVETGETRTILQTDGMYHVEGWAPDGRRLIAARNDSSSNTDLFEIDCESGDHRLLTLHEGNARFLQPSYRRDGKALYVLTDLGRDYLALKELDLATGTWRSIFEEEWDVELYSVSPDGRSIATVTNLEGYSDLIVLDLDSGRRQVVDVPRGQGHVVLFANNPMWRQQTQGSFFLLFNALLNFDNLNAGRAK